MKNPILAAILNIIPGLGYLYAGRKKVFAVLLLVSQVLCVTEILAYQEIYNVYENMPITVLGVTWCVLLEAAFIYDGYKEAQLANGTNAKSSRKSPK